MSTKLLLAWLIVLCSQLAPALAQDTETRLSLSAPLSFVGGDGKPITTDDFKVKWLFVYFGYMNCADQCPLGLSTMSEAIDELGKGARHLQPLFVTVDPERDSGDPLKRFAASFHPSLIGLTGSNDQIAVAAKAMGVFFQKAQQASGYTVDHSSSYSLVDPERRSVVTFKQGEPHIVAARIVKALIDSGADLSDMTNLGAFK